MGQQQLGEALTVYNSASPSPSGLSSRLQNSVLLSPSGLCLWLLALTLFLVILGLLISKPLTSQPLEFCYSFQAGTFLLLRKVLPRTSWVWLCFCDHGPLLPFLHLFLLPVPGQNLPPIWLVVSTCWTPHFILCLRPCIANHHILN